MPDIIDGPPTADRRAPGERTEGTAPPAAAPAEADAPDILELLSAVRTLNRAWDSAHRKAELEDPLRAARRRVLAATAEQETVTAEELPRRWPLTRRHISLVLSGLHEDGLVDEADTAEPASRAYRLTDAGRTELARMCDHEVARIAPADDRPNATETALATRVVRDLVRAIRHGASD